MYVDSIATASLSSTPNGGPFGVDMKFACFAGNDGPQPGWIDDALGIIRPVYAAKDMVDLIRRLGFNPPKFLKAGDEVSMSITGLGTLTNRFA